MQAIFHRIVIAGLFLFAAADALAKDTIASQGISLTAAENADETARAQGHLGVQQGLQNIAKAIDVIYRRSPFSAARLETLKQNGRIVIFYDPSYQNEKKGGFALASFFPDYYKKNSKQEDAKQFMVVVGPHVVKWPTEELAMIIVHELVGHGMQHFLGHLDYIRTLDLECAANLYSEKFYQDLGIDKANADVIKFRQEMEMHWCSDFKGYMKENAPSQMALWDVINPDAPKLLTIFNAYVNKLRDNGEAAKAIKAAKEIQQEKLENLISRAAALAEAKDQHALGVIYKDGLGVEADLDKAVEWLSKAAKQGYAKSQYHLGALYAKGMGVPKNHQEAARLYRQAAEQGDANAQAQLGVMHITGHGPSKDIFMANFWLTLAKDGQLQEGSRATVIAAWKDTQSKLLPAQRAKIEEMTKNWLSKRR